MTYQLTQGGFVVRSLDGAVIPAVPANSDYRDYLAWVARGNTPDPATVPVVSTSLSSDIFMNRFTPTEQAAIWTAASTHAQIGVGLTLGLAQGFVDVASPILQGWVDLCIAAGAVASNRRATLLALPS